MTFFAPNTQEALDAFNVIAPSMSQSELAATFNYHAVPNFIGYSSQLKSGMQLQTVEGTNLTKRLWFRIISLLMESCI